MILLFKINLSKDMVERSFFRTFAAHYVPTRASTKHLNQQNQKEMKKIIFIAAMVLGITLEMNAQLPQVTLKDINGKTVRTDTLSNNGKPFIISFFATWCKPCNRELTAISEVYDEWQEETGVKLYAVSIDQAQNINKVKPLVDQHEWPYEVLLDPNSELKRQLGIQMIPYVLIIDGKGKSIMDIQKEPRKNSSRK